MKSGLSLAIVTAAASLWLTITERASACSFTEACDVRSATCDAGQCRVAPAPLLFPQRDELGAPITLLEPGDREQTTSEPRLRWVYPEGADVVTVAVLRRLPQYAAGQTVAQLAGPDVVWLWRSTDNGGPGISVADYATGRQYVEGEDKSCTEQSQVPDPLAPGTYYWAVWGVSSGQLVARSLVRAFTVGKETITGRHCAENKECGELAGARCYAEKFFCVIGCASDADCFTGATCDLGALQYGQTTGICRPRFDCACADNETCDEQTKICYRGIDAGNGDAGCDCPGGGPGSGSTKVQYCVPMAGFVMFGWRFGKRRKTRR